MAEPSPHEADHRVNRSDLSPLDDLIRYRDKLSFWVTVYFFVTLGLFFYEVQYLRRQEPFDDLEFIARTFLSFVLMVMFLAIFEALRERSSYHVLEWGQFGNATMAFFVLSIPSVFGFITVMVSLYLLASPIIFLGLMPLICIGISIYLRPHRSRFYYELAQKAIVVRTSRWPLGPRRWFRYPIDQCVLEVYPLIHSAQRGLTRVVLIPMWIEAAGGMISKEDAAERGIWMTLTAAGRVYTLTQFLGAFRAKQIIHKISATTAIETRGLELLG